MNLLISVQVKIFVDKGWVGHYSGLYPYSHTCFCPVSSSKYTTLSVALPKGEVNYVVESATGKRFCSTWADRGKAAQIAHALNLVERVAYCNMTERIEAKLQMIEAAYNNP